MQKAAYMTEVHEWLNRETRPLDTIIQEYEKLNNIAADLVKVGEEIKKLGKRNFSGRKKPRQLLTEKQKNLEEEYDHQKSNLESKFISDSGHFKLTIVGRFVKLANSYENIDHLHNVDRLKGIRSWLKKLEKLEKENSPERIAWVPLSELNNPIRCFLLFPLFAIRRATTKEDFHTSLTKVLTLAKHDWLKNPGWHEATFVTDIAMIYALVLDFVLDKGVKEALDFTDNICNDWYNAPRIEMGGCSDYFRGFIDLVGKREPDNYEIEGYSGTLYPSPSVYAKFQVNRKTSRAEWHIPLTTEDYNNRWAWALFFEKQQNL
ncbi:hypothetical protein IWQ62_003310 [Dispira parvispora]|uniref:Uncharacterized protein n=1 Tax=Dispira parvispora TaxID=1520584 RepID=A0A9W8E1S3_9FUNG|nr:hypothetical protein IWQ62_003310 [Dispira parvispora]